MQRSADSTGDAIAPPLPAQSFPLTSLGQIGRFVLLRELGSGGFGQVFLARDPQLGIEVALKVPTFSRDETKRVRRFLDEAKAAARLHHPHIVAVFEAGEASGKYYISAQYVAGETLKARCQREPPTFKQAAVWTKSLAEALAYAHSEGIVHRDIKPENVMLDAKRGEPLLMDFGLAKRVDDEASHTIDGTVMGTPRYMSYEQAQGDMRQVDAASDQYSLGMVLFEMLTGRVAFEGTAQETLGKILTQDVPAPRSLCVTIPRDLDAICQKALSRERGQRYATTADFAADLGRFLSDIPTLARPLGPADRLWRWTKRNPAIAGSLAAVAVSIFLGATVSLGLSLYAGYKAAAERTAISKFAESDRKKREFEQRAKLESDKAQVESKRAFRETYLSNFRLARTAWIGADIPAFRKHVVGTLPAATGNHDFRGFEWDCLVNESLRHSVLQEHTGDVMAIAASPDGKWFGSESKDKTIRLWDTATGKSVLVLESLPTHRVVAGWDLDFSPDSRLIASAGGVIWNVASGTVLHVLYQPDDSQYVRSDCVRFSVDGRHLVSGHVDGSLCLWDTTSGEKQQVIDAVYPVERLALSPDGKLLCAMHTHGQLTVWNTKKWEQLASLPADYQDRYLCMAMAPLPDTAEGLGDAGSTLLVTGSKSGVVTLWSRGLLKGTLQRKSTLSGHTDPVTGVAFSPKGNVLYSCSHDNTVRSWPLVTGPDTTVGRILGERIAPQTFRGHTNFVQGLALGGNGTVLVSCGLDDAVIRWSLAGQIEQDTAQPTFGRQNSDQGNALQEIGALRAIAVTPDNQHLLSTWSAMGSYLLRWDVATGRIVERTPMYGTRPPAGAKTGQDFIGRKEHGYAISADCQSFASGVGDGSVKLRSTVTGKVTRTLKGHTAPVHCVAFDNSGRHVVSGSDDKTVRLWRADTGELLHVLRGYESPLIAVSLSPDARHVVACCGPDVLLWDAESGEILAKLTGHVQDVTCLAFCPDSKLLGSGSKDGAIKLWNIPSGQEASSLRGHTSAVACLVFGPEGRVLASACKLDNPVQLWDCATGQPLSTLAELTAPPVALAFSADGQVLASRDAAGMIQIWDGAPRNRSFLSNVRLDQR